MKYRTFGFAALAALSLLAGTPARADNMASIAIAPATGAVTLVPRWSLGGNLAGFHFMAQDLSLTSGAANEFYSIKNTAIPAGGDISAFTFYVAGSGAATNHSDIGSKLTPNSYSALTSADPDLGYGSVQFYLIHHKTDGDYFTHIVPSSATASAVTDLKPMSGPGGPSTGGASGYFGLTFAASNLGYGLNMFYYLRTDAVTGHTMFGTLSPALAGTAADQFDLGANGHNALAFTGTDVGFGVNQMYFQRLDPITGFTVLGTLNPVSGRAADVANLGSVYSTLTYVPGDVGYGSSLFYTTGTVNPTWQSVSFAAIADRLINAGPFTVAPSAGSGLAIALTVVPGSTGSAAITGPVAGVFTVTPTAPGVITLQATQAGSPGLFEFNMLRQTFTVTGAATLAISQQPVAHSAPVGTTTTFSVTASGATTVSYQWRKGGTNIAGNASATTATLSLTNVQAADAASYDVAVTNLSGTIVSDAALLTVTTAAPVITNSPLTAAATVGAAFTFTVTASGTPTTYTATPLPAGMTIAAATGVISGTPTTVGTTSVLLGATNGSGTGNATLTITVTAAGVAPVITNNPLTAGGTVGTAFNFAIVASNSPTSYTATPLPAGLSIASTTGVITGTPTTVGTTSVLLGATNSTGTGHATLVITVAAAGVTPTVTNSPLTAAGTVGTPFSFAVTAAGSATSFSASPLPAGLSIVNATGVITGTPTAVGTTFVLLGATNSTGTGNATLTVTVAAAGVAPIITNNPQTAAGTVGTPFSFFVTASGSPTSYGASPLPAGLSIVSPTGGITGVPTTAGVTVIQLSAENSTGSDTATLTVTIAPKAVTPIITNTALTPAGTVGVPFTFTVVASGTPTTYGASGLPAGLTLNAATGVITGLPTAAGTSTVTLTASNSAGTATTVITIKVALPTVTPVITSASTAGGTAGTPFVTYVIAASGIPTSYTATGLPTGLTLNSLTGAINGTPTVSGTFTVTINATNTAGTSTATVVITIAAAPYSRIVNFSARAISGPGDQGLIMGFVVSGNAKNLLVRGVGPGLTAFGVGNVLADPLLTLYNGSTVIATNDDWQTTIAGQPDNSQVPVVSARVGAFALANGSKDAALLATFNDGAHTTSLVRPNGTTGVALTEIYDTDTTFTARLINVSARMNVALGEGVLTAGFVIGGNKPKTVLIRGVGPTLGAFGVGGTLVDPQIAVFSGTTMVASNDNWEVNTTGTATQIRDASARVGAFALPAGSKDAVLLLMLSPGNYTVQVTGVANTTGIALVEIYDAE